MIEWCGNCIHDLRYLKIIFSTRSYFMSQLRKLYVKTWLCRKKTKHQCWGRVKLLFWHVNLKSLLCQIIPTTHPGTVELEVTWSELTDLSVSISMGQLSFYTFWSLDHAFWRCFLGRSPNLLKSLTADISLTNMFCLGDTMAKTWCWCCWGANLLLTHSGDVLEPN